MKHLLLILTALLISVCSFGQSKEIKGGTIVQGGEASDTVTASASKSYVVFLKSSASDKYDYSVQVETDSISGTPGYTAKLQYSNNYSDWFDLNTVTTSTGVDTSFVVTKTANTYKYLRYLITGSATAQKSKAKVTWFFVK